MHHHNFAMSCILQNTFDADLEINHINPVEYQFKDTADFYPMRFSDMLTSNILIKLK